ncbi:MAG: TRAP transporter permease [Lachnospiraceae bacterium]|nr:TRAP transporter permease [Lachnospiraceae bacterium]
MSSEIEKNIVNANNTTEQDLDEIMRKYDRESNTRIWEGKAKIVMNTLTAVFSLYCIWSTMFSTAQPETKLTLFLGMITIIGFLTYPAQKKNVRPNHMPIYDILIMLVGAGCYFYFAINAVNIIKMQANTNIGTLQVAIGVIAILITVELCRRCVGIPILCVVGVLVLYAFINSMAYGMRFSVALRVIIDKLFYSTNGVIGTPVNVCYKYIVLFIIFGAFLERTGISNFFISLANRIAGRSSGGPAKVAVISSALCGMVSGSSVGNTVTTGSVTIPMMKKTGYKPEFAGAVEAAASTGGQIMPPIMGAAAFLMAEYMDIPYAQVAAKAILPAVLYFAGIFIAVHLEAKKLGLKGMSKDEMPKTKYLITNCYLLIPLIILVWLVASGAKTMQFSAAIAIIAAIVIGYINKIQNAVAEKDGDGEKRSVVQSIGKATKETLFSTADALSAGAKGGVTVAVACAMAGVISGCITVTGLASVMINAIVKVAGNATIVGLLLTMLCCIVLGMGVPTTANYCIMASTCAPILIELGFPVVAAHFFVFYFGIVADITPPVALAAYAGSAIAKSNPMKTGINASKLAIAAFVVPYIFAYSPAMLFDGSTALYEVLLISVSAIVGLFGIAASLNGFLFKQIPVVLRLILAAGGLCMMIPGTLTDVIGLCVVGGITAMLFVASRKTAAKAA